MNALRSGECEPLKEAVHTIARDVFAVMGVYSLSAFTYRAATKQGWHWHLLVNAAFDAVVVLVEHRHVETHRKAR